MANLLKISFVLILGSHFAFGFSKETIDVKSQFTDEIIKISVLSKTDADELFVRLSTKSLVDFNLIHDGCYARTYMMIGSAQLKNVYMAKRVVEVINKKEGTININVPDQQWVLRWYYHVAPMLYVRNDHTLEAEEYIFDPGLFNRPVTKKEFIDALSENTKASLGSFILPAYVSEKTQLSKNVNMSRLDHAMLVKQSEVASFAKIHGKYLEKTALFDDIQNKCFKGGLEVRIEDCTQ